jgi:hypothetical protein
MPCTSLVLRKSTTNNEHVQCLLNTRVLLGDPREPKSPKVFGEGGPFPRETFSEKWTHIGMRQAVSFKMV